MAGSYCPLTTATGLAVASDLGAMMADTDPTAGDHDFHRLADQPPRNAAAIGVELDGGIRLHPPGQLAHLAERRPPVEPAQGGRFLAGETLIGASPVVPWTRVSATSRIHQARCDSSSDQLANAWAAIALCLT
jgi:hypothetical protein